MWLACAHHANDLSLSSTFASTRGMLLKLAKKKDDPESHGCNLPFCSVPCSALLTEGNHSLSLITFTPTLSWRTQTHMPHHRTDSEKQCVYMAALWTQGEVKRWETRLVVKQKIAQAGRRRWKTRGRPERDDIVKTLPNVSPMKNIERSGCRNRRTFPRSLTL